MGNLLTRILDGPVPSGDYDVIAYQISLRRRRRIILGTLSATAMMLGIKLSGSFIIGLYVSCVVYSQVVDNQALFKTYIVSYFYILLLRVSIKP